MKGAVFSGSRTLWVKQEWPRAPHPVLILDKVKDMVHKDFKWCEVGFLFVGLGRGPWGLCGRHRSTILVLWEGRLQFSFSHGRAIDYAAGRIFDLNVLLSLILVTSCFTKCL